MWLFLIGYSDHFHFIAHGYFKCLIRYTKLKRDFISLYCHNRWNHCQMWGCTALKWETRIVCETSRFSSFQDNHIEIIHITWLIKIVNQQFAKTPLFRKILTPIMPRWFPSRVRYRGIFLVQGLIWHFAIITTGLNVCYSRTLCNRTAVFL